MENLKAIKDRIRTVDSIIKATSAMKMVSTVKLAKINNANKYSKECSDILFDMFSRAVREVVFKQEFNEEPWFYRKNGETLIIVLSMDQGFCGSFSQGIIDKANDIIKNNPNAYVEVFGKKGSDIFQKTLDIGISRDLTSRYDIDVFSSLLAKLVFKYIHDHNINEVYVVSGEFKNVLVQKARSLKIFPVDLNKDITKEQYTSVEGSHLNFIDNVFQMYLSKLFKGIVTEHLISELSARVMAMDNSVRNANDMFEKLNVLYNRVRQARITQELTEIVSSIECVQ
ncbi:MAG: FoF1 ATP synthase subunit gamma [Alphaproteobacteria bacterium]|nr:FoF1 ATP synthase subunit gamma [Alphaproteobacteria bacterium]